MRHLQSITWSLLMDGNKDITAVFTEDKYHLTVRVDGQRLVDMDPEQRTYLYDDQVTLTAREDPGWTFSAWSGAIVSNLNPLIMTIRNSAVVTAAISQDEYDVSISVTGNGSVSQEPNGDTCHYGDEITLLAIPGPGCTFGGWSGDLSRTDNPASLIFDRDLAVNAFFVYRVHLPIIPRRWPPYPGKTPLVPIENADGNGSYTVAWGASSDSDRYVLQEATSNAFVEVTIIYTGPATSYGASGRGAARYYYRVKALNRWTESEWSNVRQVDVLWEAETNDTYIRANGPIVPTLVYNGTFPNSDDVSDYYYFELARAHRVKIWLTNIPAGQNYDLVLRDASLTDIGYSGEPGSSIEHITKDLSPGRYYIQVYHFSSGGSTQPYNLQFVLE